MNDAFSAALGRLGDVTVRLAVELGRAEMSLSEVLRLGEDSTIALDRMTDELLDVTANGRVIARGEVVVDKGRFGLRIVELVGDAECRAADHGAAQGFAPPLSEPPRAGETTGFGA